MRSGTFISILLLSLLLLASSCEQRYWYRQKVWVGNSKPFKGKIDVKVMNFSPEFISRDFEKVIKNAGMQYMVKSGYKAVSKDSPDFRLIIMMHVDSYYVYKSRTGMFSRNPVTRAVVPSRMSGGYMREVNSLLELSFRYQFVRTKNSVTLWEDENGLYYFNSERRDLPRSVGLVKYDLSNIP